MSLSQIHELDRIVRKRHRKLKRELKILEIKKVINNKFYLFIGDVTDTFNDIINRFAYENKGLVLAKRK